MSSSPVQPETEFERELTAIWRELLEGRELGIHDNFFDLGGNSLLLTRMQLRISKWLQRPIPMTALFQFSTVHALAGFCAKLGRDEEPSPREAAERPRSSARMGGDSAAAVRRRLRRQARTEGEQ